MSINQPKVLTVGHCSFDHPNIQRMLSGAFRATVERTDTADQTVARMRTERFELVLINRVLDADGSAGVDLIRRLKQDEATRAVPVMLVSNYADAQQAAVALGAEPGFGKGALDDPTTVALLAPYLNPQIAQIQQGNNAES